MSVRRRELRRLRNLDLHEQRPCMVCRGPRVTPVWWPDDDPKRHPPSMLIVVGDPPEVEDDPVGDWPCASCGRSIRTYL